MTAYYNEWDGPTADWLEELIRRRLIADGIVDRRSILDVSASDLKDFTQCHFFAGIGGWSYALRLAGWPDDRPVWSGSPPCQPFSSAGQQKGQDDERHLAPHFAELIAEGRPPIIFGEQVASSAVFGKAATSLDDIARLANQWEEDRLAGKPIKKRRGQQLGAWAWLDDLSERLEATHYAIGASDIPSASIGAPHRRQRTFFGAVRLADTSDNGRHKDGQRVTAPQRDGFVGDSAVEWLGLSDSQGLQGHGRLVGVDDTSGRQDQGRHSSTSGMVERLADSNGRQRQRLTDGERLIINGEATRRLESDSEFERGSTGERVVVGERPRTPDSPWGTADWLFCRDGKWRPVEPNTSPLANGVSARVVRLRGYGNAINPWAAKVFIEAFVDTLRSSPDFVHCKSPLPLVNSTKRNIEDLL